MRLISANLNGIRAAESKGFFKWLKSQEADVVCLQETRIQPEQLSDIMLEPDGLKSAFEFAEQQDKLLTDAVEKLQDQGSLALEATGLVSDDEIGRASCRERV